jgi:hypothetical protein
MVDRMSYIPNTDLSLSQFGALQTAERTPVIELASIYGLSALRDVVTVAGGGTVTHAGPSLASVFTVATTASGTDSAILDSAERGRYQPGNEGEIGIGIRMDSATRTGSQKAEWGAFTDVDGFIFGLDSAGFYVAVRKDSTDLITRQADFNVDRFDGTGPSGLTLDLLKGNIFQVDFTWYGFGNIIFHVVTAGLDGIQRKYILHRFTPTAGQSTNNPNLPLRARLQNGGTATAQTMYVAGRQYSIFGRYNPNRRSNGHFLSTPLTGIGTTFVPVMSFRRKTAFATVSAKSSSMEALANANMYWQLRLNGTLTGAVYGTPANTTAAETCMEVDTTATAITGGQVINAGGIISASVGNSVSISTALWDGLDIPNGQPVTLCVRKLSGVSGTVDGLTLRWREEW